MRYNVDHVASALQGAEDTSSDTVTAIDCYQAEWEITQVQGKGQAKQVHCAFCVWLWLLSRMSFMGLLALAKCSELSLLCQCCTK